MNSIVIREATVVNDGLTHVADVLVRNGIIECIAPEGLGDVGGNTTELNATGNYLLAGVVDDQGHFRKPGLTQKEDNAHASAAAAAGGVTSFMEMPNTWVNGEQVYAQGAENTSIRGQRLRLDR